ncbi:MAG: aldehyde dehydrogenase [Mycobacterium sp.]|jgi:acyl-CoA reductase-like NAD-dependent aldehyde dehydrogenase|nr:aldehyde dehydrogenase [Mycobacterium sp.]
MTNAAHVVAQRRFDKLFIGGEWITRSSSAVLTVTSPATGKAVGSVPCGDGVDVDRAVMAARRSFEAGVWASTPPAQRADVLGGYKQSGIGRENGPEGLESYLEHKSVMLPLGYSAP